MTDIAVSVLQGAQLVLEAVSAETSLSVSVTEMRVAIEVSPAEAPLVIVTEPAPVDLIEVLLPNAGGGGAPAPVQYDRRVDLAAEDVVYRAEAALGASEAAPAWRIRRITIDAAGAPLVAWAGGSRAFSHAWADRLNYSYE